MGIFYRREIKDSSDKSSTKSETCRVEKERGKPNAKAGLPAMMARECGARNKEKFTTS